MLAASVAIAVLSGGATYLLMSPRASSPAAPAPVVESGAGGAVLDAIALSYAGQLTALQAMLDARSARLDPATRATIERSLRTVDNAIRESLSALERNPADVFLLDRYRGVMDAKVGLLHAALAAPVAPE
jgi:hypothetical protein